MTHVALDLAADFATHRLSGTATLTVHSTPAAREIVLDTRDLAIEAVTDGQGRPLSHELAAADPILGRALRVTLPEDRRRIVVRYTTSPQAAALQWLQPAQTAGGKQPYLFSQGQAILTRSWIPTQDSPGIRQTYEARIAVPKPLVAVMSAEQLTPDGEPSGAARAFRFRLTQPIPPYLIALAVGDIAFRSIGPRTGVYAEPVRRRKRRVRVRRPREDGRGRRGARRSLSLGTLRHARAAAVVPVRRHGESAPHVRDADDPRGRSIADVARRARARALVVGQPRHQRDVARLLAERGLHDYFENRIMEALYGPERAAMLESLGRRELLDELAALKDEPGDQILHLESRRARSRRWRDAGRVRKGRGVPEDDRARGRPRRGSTRGWWAISTATRSRR